MSIVAFLVSGVFVTITMGSISLSTIFALVVTLEWTHATDGQSKERGGGVFLFSLALDAFHDCKVIVKKHTNERNKEGAGKLVS